MNRVDRKFWFTAEKLEHLLEKLTPFYDILEVDGRRMVEYQTIYFDTFCNQMYLHHHNGYRDRYKIRRRKYETSEYGFFEIKRKTNKQRTVKKRITIPFHEGAITEAEIRFIKENFSCGQLNPQPVHFNVFRRISLISKQKNERCTVDVQLIVRKGKEEVSLEKLAIIELKQGNLIQASPLMAFLKELGIWRKGLSKYCTGRSLIEQDLKRNNFKPRLLHLEKKIINNQRLCITS